MNSPILVLGARGNVGRPLVSLLQAQGQAVRAATRSGAPVDGAPGVVFDHGDPRTHAAAFDGVERAYVMLPAGQLAIQERLLPIVQGLAARGAKIVFQSAFGVDADDSIPYRQVELALERSGTPWVTLRPNWFADNFHTYWRHDLLQGRLKLPAGSGRTSFIDVRDIAASAAAALLREDVKNRAYDLTGPEALSYAEAADRLQAGLGRPVRYEALSDADFIAHVQQGGVPADYAAFLAALFHPVREGWAAAVTDEVRSLTGQAPRDLRRYIEDHRAELSA